MFQYKIKLIKNVVFRFLEQQYNHIGFLLFLILFFLTFQAATSFAQKRAKGISQYWKTNKNKRSVSLREFREIIPKNAIKSLERPRFLTEREAVEKYQANEPFVVVTINKIQKAYPLKVLLYHEVINDFLVGKPIAITYNPLCNSVAVYHRRLKFESPSLLNFSVSGMLRKGNSVLWDKETESWWQQITGECLVGKLKGTTLKRVPFTILSFQQFYKSYPYGLIMSPLGDGTTKYGTTPYYKYDDITKEKPLLFPEMPSERLPAMQRIVNLQLGDTSIIYPLEIVLKRSVFQDKPLGNSVVIFSKKGVPSVLDEEYILESKDVGMFQVFSGFLNGQQLLTFKETNRGFKDIETNSTWSFTGKCIKGHLKGKQLKPLHYQLHFAFAALIFYPKSIIYGEVY